MINLSTSSQSTMEKKYQVFLSSTYQDLIVERSRVAHALLEMDCIPAGMEQFPAGNDSQWPTIQKMIANCDYYVLILAGRYGSLHSTGVSYTELEYRFAEQCGIPIAAFVRDDIDSIPAKFCESDEDKIRKLSHFRAYTKNRMCKLWKVPEELPGVVSTSLYQLFKAHPREGWVRRSHLAIDPYHLQNRRERIESILLVAMRAISLIPSKSKAQIRCLVTLLDATGSKRYTICGVNTRTDPEKRSGVPTDFGVAGKAFTTLKYVAEDLPSDHVKGYTIDVRDLIWDKLRSVVACPLTDENGKSIGTLNFDSTHKLSQCALGHSSFETMVWDAARAITPYISELYRGQR
jgi:Domain of unknown function (DUF4062)